LPRRAAVGNAASGAPVREILRQQGANESVERDGGDDEGVDH
jgi:hypothetical protein